MNISYHSRRIPIDLCRIRPVERRFFFSSLWDDKKDDDEVDRLKLQIEEQMLIDRTNYRMSIQHAHPLGPWQAMLAVAKSHHATWEIAERKKNLTAATISRFQVLDLACGPRGEPGTTIAHALPLAAVTCTDSCSEVVAAVVVIEDIVETTALGNRKQSRKDNIDDFCKDGKDHRTPPPSNLTKAIADLTDLSSYESNTCDVITCCYGYGLSSDVSFALSEAHRVLVPGGVLIIATWEQSALLSNGRDILASVRGGGRDVHAAEDDDAFLPPRLPPPNIIALSGPGEFEALLISAGFDHPGAVVTSWGTYPFDLGSQSDDQFAMGTILIRSELESLGALRSAKRGYGAGGWKNLAEESFFINIHKYTDMVDGTMFLRDNTFKLTISTKQVFQATNKTHMSSNFES
jgi:SAM-dependent methyltransferase